MSEKTTKTFISELAIVRKIAAFLKLGDSGKLDSFFTRILKTLNREIDGLKKNIETNKFNYKQTLDDLKDQVEDAREALTEQFMSVDPTQVATRELQKNYVDVYLKSISNKEADIDALEERIIKKKEELKEQNDTIQKRISARQNRIKTITTA